MGNHRIPALLLVATSFGCVSTSSNIRHIEKGTHEIAVEVGAGAVVVLPNLSLGVAYRYGVSDKVNLRYQLSYQNFFGLDNRFGFLYRITNQKSWFPEFDIAFDWGGGFYYFNGSSVWSNSLNYYLSSGVSFTASYLFDTGTNLYFGLSGLTPFVFQSTPSDPNNVLTAICRPAQTYSMPKLEVLLGIEQRIWWDWVRVQFEVKAGSLLVGSGFSGSNYPYFPYPYIQIFPGIRFII